MSVVCSNRTLSEFLSANGLTCMLPLAERMGGDRQKSYMLLVNKVKYTPRVERSLLKSNPSRERLSNFNKYGRTRIQN